MPSGAVWPRVGTGPGGHERPEQEVQGLDQVPELPVRVRGVREDGTTVVEGVIRLWVTPRRGSVE